MNVEEVFFCLGLGVLVCPILLLILLGGPAFFRCPLNERAINLATSLLIVLGLVQVLAILGLMLASGVRHVPIEFGDWVVLPTSELNHVPFHFHLKVVFDRLSVPFLILTFLLCGTIGLFASRYLHREPGYVRFFMAFAIFTLGMVVASVAGTIEVLFFGWELVGLSSALLIAFFQERTGPVRNGLRVWCIYRLADAAFLIAAIAMHHLTGEGEFSRLTGEGSWPDGVASFSSTQAMFVGLLLLIAAAGKSALVPFSGWLPRAMEGPTPSSAIFYGALSVHLGAFLLLRTSPIIECSLITASAVLFLGGVTAVFGAVAGRVQADIKTILAFASLTQVGLIVAEIGLAALAGFMQWTNVANNLRYFALVHILGHAGLRTLQLLRAPSLLHDYRAVENAIGRRLPQAGGLPVQAFSQVIYGFAFERGGFDPALERLFVRPFLKLLRACHRCELAWLKWISGEGGRRDHGGGNDA